MLRPLWSEHEPYNTGLETYLPPPPPSTPENFSEPHAFHRFGFGGRFAPPSPLHRFGFGGRFAPPPLLPLFGLGGRFAPPFLSPSPRRWRALRAPSPPPLLSALTDGSLNYTPSFGFDVCIPTTPSPLGTNPISFPMNII